ncbi:MAG: periplasmic heavy metal sensor [bacterium]|nr:periplasmic heavy metal sensor [bacterium]
MTHRKTIALIAVALLALLPLAAFAGPGEGPGHRGHGRGPDGPMIPPPGYLDLNDEQIEAAEALRDDARAQLEGVREQTRALHEQMKAALETDNPDALTVGQLAIEIHGLRDRVRTVREDVETQFAALLDAEQLEKWENFKELRESRRGPRHRGGSGKGFRGGFGDGSDSP